jgi:hypothetical protein
MKKTLLFTLLLAVLLFGFDTKAYDGLLLGSYSNDTQEQLYAKNTKKNRKANKSKATNKGGFVGTWQLVDKDKKGYERYLVITKENGSYYGKLSCYDLGYNSEKVMAESFRSGLSFTFDEKFYPNNYVTVFLRGNKLIEGETTYDIFGNATEWVEKTWRRVSGLPAQANNFTEDIPMGTWIANVGGDVLEITFDEDQKTFYALLCHQEFKTEQNIRTEKIFDGLNNEKYTSKVGDIKYIYAVKLAGSFSIFNDGRYEYMKFDVDDNTIAKSIYCNFFPKNINDEMYTTIENNYGGSYIPFVKEFFAWQFVLRKSRDSFSILYKSGEYIDFQKTDKKISIPKR